jgi:hypothetical protein
MLKTINGKKRYNVTLFTRYGVFDQEHLAHTLNEATNHYLALVLSEYQDKPDARIETAYGFGRASILHPNGRILIDPA